MVSYSKGSCVVCYRIVRGGVWHGIVSYAMVWYRVLHTPVGAAIE